MGISCPVNTFYKLYNHKIAAYCSSVVGKRCEYLSQCIIIGYHARCTSHKKITIFAIPSRESLLPVSFIGCLCRISFISNYFLWPREFDIPSVDCIWYEGIFDIDTHLMVPRLGSSVEVEYQDQIFKKIWPLQWQLCFTKASCFSL